MPSASSGDFLRHLRRLCAAQGDCALTDGQLLEQFVEHQDDAAFTFLVHRHGPMVYSVCRRVLGELHSAEDAFQATFLVLARRAASLNRSQTLANWLYGVAQRVARRARAHATMRRSKEKQVPPAVQPEPIDELTWQEVCTVLDEELARLPGKYRAAIVLCHLEGKSYEQAAGQLDCPKSTLEKRLGRGREMLRQQLSRRGVTISAGTVLTVLSDNARAAPVGVLLKLKTTQAAAGVAAGKTVAGHILSANAMALAEGAMRGLIGIKVKVAMLLVTLGLAVGGAALAGHALTRETSESSQSDQTSNAEAKAEKNSPQPVLAKATDRYGDFLPPGAVARFGTARFRHDTLTSSVAYGLSGKVLVSGGGMGYGVCIWDAVTGQSLNRLSVPPSSVVITVSPDGKTLVTSDLRVIDLASGKQIGRLPWSGRSMAWIDIAPDGRTAAVVTQDNERKVALYDLTTQKEIRSFEGPSPNVNGPAFSPDGKILAVCGNDRKIRLWDLATGTMRGQLAVSSADCHIVFASGGKVLASAGPNDALRLWDVETLMLIHEVKEVQEAICLAASAGGKLLAAIADNKTIYLYEAETAKEIRRLQGRTFGMPGLLTDHGAAFSPDGKVLAVAMGSGIVRWDVGSGLEIDPVIGHSTQVKLLQFRPNGKTLSSSAGDQVSVSLEWDLPSQQEQSRVVFGPFQIGRRKFDGRIADVSADHQIVAVVGGVIVDSNIHLCDARTGKEIRVLEGPFESSRGFTNNVRSAKFSPDGKLLLSQDADADHLWDVAGGAKLQRWEGLLAIAFSPDSRVLATVWPDKTIRLLGTADGKEIRRWESREDRVLDLAFSADGKLLASVPYASNPKDKVRVWAIDSGIEIARFGDLGLFETLSALTFSPDRRTVAAIHQKMPKLSSGDLEINYEIAIWELLTGQVIRSTDAGHTSVKCLAFTPDNRMLASGSGDSTILLWDFTDKAKAGKRPAPSAAEMNTLWDDLSHDAAKAYSALWTLVMAPEKSTPFLKDRLRPTAPAPADQTVKLIADLDSDRFATRDKAAKALEDFDDAAEGAIRIALEGKTTLETRRRLELIIQKGEKFLFQKLRAIAALEHIGTPQAREVLQAVAASSPNPRVAEAAALAAKRIADASKDKT